MRRQRDEAAPVAPPPGSIVSPLVLLVTVVSDVVGEVVAIAAILGNVEVVPSETGQVLHPSPDGGAMEKEFQR
jgi:hypothetical protein